MPPEDDDVPRTRLPIGRRDRLIAGFVKRHSPGRAVDLASAVSWLGDARVLLACGVAWVSLAPPRSRRRQDAVHFLATIATTTALHHLAKRIVAQRRPDRAMTGAMVRTGRPDDAMPSGHAMHAGAIASFLSGITRRPVLPFAATAPIAAARIVILAHWPSGVVAGYGGGVLLERVWRAILGPRPRME